MIRSILTPLDGSALADRAIPLAVALARVHEARLAVVKVQPTRRPSGTHGAPGIDPAFDAARLAADARHLDRVVARAIEAGCREAKRFLLEGEVLDEIENFVRGQDIDLVVMSTHGRGGLSRAWLGSVAEGLIRRLSVPVLLTRQGARWLRGSPSPAPFSRVLVALDGSPHGERVIDEVLRLAGGMPLHLTLAHVIQPAAMALSPLAASALDAEVREAYLTPLAERLRALGPTVSVEVVVHAHAARALIELARRDGSDLMALSTHGERGVRRLLVGSVADKLIRASAVPVLVGRRGD